VLLLLADGTQVPVTELPGQGPWTFLVLRPEESGPPSAEVVSDPGAVGRDPGATGPERGGASRLPAVPDPDAAGPEPGSVAQALTRFGRAVVPDLRGRPGWGTPAGGLGFLDLVDDLDQVRTRAGLGRPVLVGLGELAPVALRAAADQPWAWRALVLVQPAAPAAAAELDRLDLPALIFDADPSSAPGMAALERLLDRLGGGPGWAGIAPDAPPR
jgi:pimeloyl-ACP methyl ester carboxylesterase